MNPNLMQEFIFIRHSKGVSAKGNDYDLVEVSDGRATFTLENGMGETFPDLKEGDKFFCIVHVTLRFNRINGKIVAIE